MSTTWIFVSLLLPLAGALLAALPRLPAVVLRVLMAVAAVPAVVVAAGVPVGQFFVINGLVLGGDLG
ncbi:MAG: hypothetical protein ACFB21_04135, partial [Opitutales bacterium]